MPSVSLVFSPSESSDLTVARESRIRMTTFSPSAAGSVETRRSIGWPFTATRARPSWGRSRSAISSDDMILMREISGRPAWRGIFITCRSTPSIRYRTATPPSSGSMWMSLERARIPSEMIRSTRRTTGRWLASASEAAMVISSGARLSCSCTSSAEFSIPSSSLSTAFSGRYSSSSRAAILEGASRNIRISRAVADAFLGRRIELRQVRDLQSEAGGQRREDLVVARDLLGHEGLPQPRRWRGLLPQLHQQLWGDDTLERARQPFIREVCVGHPVNKVVNLREVGEARGGSGGWGRVEEVIRRAIQPSPTSPNLHNLLYSIPQKSRVTSKASPSRCVAVPYPASQRNTPSHSNARPSVMRVPGVATQGVPVTGAAAQPSAT